MNSETAIKYTEEDARKLEDQIAGLSEDKPEESDTKELHMEVILTYIKYFMQHLEELLIDHCHPLAKAEYFGVMFDQVATSEDVKDGTKKPRQSTGVK